MGESKELKPWEKADILETRAPGIRNRVRSLGVSSLCGQCSHSMIYKRKGYTALVIRCRILGTEVPEDINECSSYDNPATMDMTQMVNLALIIDPRETPEGGNYI